MTLTPMYARPRRGGGQLTAAPMYRQGPHREMQDINDRFGQMIQTFFGDTPGLTGGWSALGGPVDVEETDDAYVVDVDLPNVNPRDVTIEMRGEELRIARRVEERERTGIPRRRTPPAGEFGDA